jgi:hypothetical protein
MYLLKYVLNCEQHFSYFGSDYPTSGLTVVKHFTLPTADLVLRSSSCGPRVRGQGVRFAGASRKHGSVQLPGPEFCARLPHCHFVAARSQLQHLPYS